MALRKLTFKPGINRDITDYAQEGGWYECNKVRFFKGFPKKIGGWTKYTTSKFNGICRSLFSFSGLQGVKYLAGGTNEKVILNAGGTSFNITPARAASGAGHATFGASNGSSTITVTEAGHGTAAGNWVTFSGAATLGGAITADILNKEYKIDAISSTDVFTFTALDADGNAIAANGSDATSGGGGGSTVATYQIDIGNPTGAEGLGWGAGLWNRAGATVTLEGGTTRAGGWGEARTGPGIFSPMRLVYFTRYQDDLLFNIRYGEIYRWVWQTTPTTAAALLSASPSSGTEVPNEVTQVLIAQDNVSNIIIALGCTPYPASGTPDRDPLLIRWSDVTNPFNFTPSDTTTAGSLTVQNGSQILRGVPTTRETLVFTESTLNSLKFIGGFDVFRLDEISSNTSLVAPNAVITVDGVTYWMGLNKFYKYDGRINTLDCTVQDEIFENYNLDQADQIFAALNSKYHEIWWFYPTAVQEGANPTITHYVTYNYLENVWFYGDCDGTSAGDASFSRTAWQDTGIYEKPYAAGADSNIYKHETGNNAATDSSPHAAMAAFITSSQVSVDQGDRFVLMNRIIPDVDFRNSNTSTDIVASTGGATVTPTINFSVFAKKYPGAATYTANESGETLTDAVTAINSTTVDQYTQQAYMRARGRSLAFKVESSAANVAWELGVPRVDFRPDGRRG
tara:strand:- start:222 stop:2267 length:2046 start_codon:yes stop_codon:yes gene_type:complete